jgi:hypothetical protein
MENITEIVRIIEGIIQGDRAKSLDYAKQLSRKLCAGGDQDGHRIARILDGDFDGEMELQIPDLLRRLDEDGATGLDLSPGDQTARDAALVIRYLLKKGNHEIENG